MYANPWFTDLQFEMLKEGKPVCLHCEYKFKDYTIEHSATKERLVIICSSRFSNMSSFERKRSN
jgi:hypothetical protein